MIRSFSFGLLMAGLIVASANCAYADGSFDVVHDARNNIVRSTFGGCVRTQWLSASDECDGVKAAKIEVAPKEEAKVFDLTSRESRTIYFEFNKSDITASELEKLDSLAGALKSEDNLRGVHIVGYTDRMGSEEYNQALSQRRAEQVEAHLREQGYIGDTKADTRWLGESEPVTYCAEKLPRAEKIACLQKDRRVEVELDYVGGKK